MNVQCVEMPGSSILNNTMKRCNVGTQFSLMDPEFGGNEILLSRMRAWHTCRGFGVGRLSDGLLRLVLCAMC